MRRLVHEFVHANRVLDLGLSHEVTQPLTCALFNALKNFGKRIQTRGDFERTVLEPHRVGRIKTNEIHFLVHVGSKILEVPFKHIRHPVPTWSHVEGEAVDLKLSSAASKCVVPFKNTHAMSGLGQVARSREAGKPGTQDQNVVAGGGVVVHGKGFSCLNNHG